MNRTFYLLAWQTWWDEYRRTGSRADLVVAKMYRRRYRTA